MTRYDKEVCPCKPFDLHLYKIYVIYTILYNKICILKKKKKNLLSVDGTVISYNDYWEFHFSNRYVIINMSYLEISD